MRRMPLSGKQVRRLRALGHSLEPVVLIGKEGLTEGVAAAVSEALLAHELIKVKLGPQSPDDRHDAADAIAERTESEVVQVLGKVILLYRRHPDEPKIELGDAQKKR
jgi:RNA-binding protein